MIVHQHTRLHSFISVLSQYSKLQRIFCDWYYVSCYWRSVVAKKYRKGTLDSGVNKISPGVRNASNRTSWCVELSVQYKRFTIQFLLRPGRGTKYCDQLVCLRVCVSVREHISGSAGPIFTNFLCRSPVAVARSSSGGVGIRYVGLLPVSWMTSRLAVMGCMAMRVYHYWRCDSGLWCLRMPCRTVR